MTEESSPDGRCERSERRLPFRQMVIDWVPVIAVVIKEVVQYFWR
ncbi:hypothetical protein AB5J56_23470 [Streptomyces sp. R21]|uniref:Uncharacterized protein n=1 Tax=Streptomyces sp. R21 TaxID=3238627 RepID=A0AB39PAL1_9ACTN